TGRLAYAILDLRLRNLSQSHPESDVRIHVEMRKKCVVLEDHRYVAVVRQLVAHVLAVEQDLSFGSDLEPGDDAHGCGLAAAGRPDEHDELALGRVEREVLDRDDIAEVLPNATELNSRHSNSPCSALKPAPTAVGDCPVLPAD